MQQSPVGRHRVGVTRARTRSRAAGANAASSNKNLVLIQGTKADNFYVTMGCGAKAEAKKLGYNITVQGPADFSAPQQIPIVHSVTATKPAAVMIAPTDEKALIKPMQAMKSAGIKVIQVDTHVSNNSIASRVDLVRQPRRAASSRPTRWRSSIHDKGSVVVMNEQPGVSTTEARIAGFLKEIKKFKNIKMLKTQFTGDNPAQAAQTITSLYSANPNLAGVFATNVLVAEGTDTGLKTTGVAGKVKIVGYDADPEQVADLKKGVVQALVAQEPYQEGVDGVQQAVNAINGKPTKSILTEAGRADEVKPQGRQQLHLQEQLLITTLGAGRALTSPAPATLQTMIVVAGEALVDLIPTRVGRSQHQSRRRALQHRRWLGAPRCRCRLPRSDRR